MTDKFLCSFWKQLITVLRSVYFVNFEHNTSKAALFRSIHTGRGALRCGDARHRNAPQRNAYGVNEHLFLTQSDRPQRKPGSGYARQLQLTHIKVSEQILSTWRFYETCESAQSSRFIVLNKANKAAFTPQTTIQLGIRYCSCNDIISCLSACVRKSEQNKVETIDGTQWSAYFRYGVVTSQGANLNLA